MAVPDKLLNEGERVVVSTRTHPKALLLPLLVLGVVDRLFGCGTLVVSDASEQGRVDLHDIPRVEQVQVKVAELHRLAGRHGRGDDGA